MEKVSLFSKKEDCCACGACVNICPKQAIRLKEDECGFLYPVIDEQQCIHCGMCKKVCAFQNVEEHNEPIMAYAAKSINHEQAIKSSSGGIFAAAASYILESDGVVFGAAFDKDWGVSHCSVESLNDLQLLQGSKYTQSNTRFSFQEAKMALSLGRKVLYSGTPCQIAGLKAYLGREYSNLFTIDLVCHGVPNNRMLKEYLDIETGGSEIEQFVFRDKRLGWGINGRLEYRGNLKKIWQTASSYLYYFTESCIYRENCYHCKYASSHRPADITIGDYWRIEREHPILLTKYHWKEQDGISLLIANTNKGCEFVQTLIGYIDLYPSTFDKAARGNAQLRHPCSGSRREEIMEIYKNGGWIALEQKFSKEIGLRKYSSQVKALIPDSLKTFLKLLRR